MVKLRGVSHTIDWLLIGLVLLISLGGILNLYSTVSFSMGKDLYLTQIYWYVFGIVVAVVVATIDFKIFERYSYFFYAAGVILLFMVLIIGKEINGSKRWLEIGGFNVQPSELIKIFVILAMGKYISSQFGKDSGAAMDVIILAMLNLLPIILIMKQPDLGSALVIFMVFISVLLLYRFSLSYLLTVIIGIFLGLPVVWSFLLKDYQKDRIRSYLNPESDILGSGWHAYQSQVAIGSGHIWGKGFLNSTQNRHGFLPANATDFPFSIWCEEEGFIGAATMLLFYFLFIILAMRIASSARDRFSMIVAFGIAIAFFWQAFFNIGMVSGVLPIVGVTLPFFSYGGSSIFMALFSVGLLLNFSIRRETHNVL